jgi:hypothetical protein
MPMLSRVSKLPLASKSVVVGGSIFGFGIKKMPMKLASLSAPEPAHPTPKKTLCYLMNLLEPYHQIYTYDTGNNLTK